MRFYSTPQSASAGEITVLAIFETIAATALSIWLAVHRGTLLHVVVGACVAPFLLLRTNVSTDLAYRWLKDSEDYNDRLESSFQGKSRLLFYALAVPGLVALNFLGPVLFRPLAIALTAIRHPLNSIRAVPGNWARTVLATDFHHPPEILPEAESTRGQLLAPAYRFSTFVKGFREELPKRDLSWSAKSAMVLVGILWFVPAALYRYSLKATAVIYLPFLWILHDSLVDASTLKYKLEDIAHSPLEQLKRWYSGCVIVFLLVVPSLIYFTINQWWQQLSDWLNRLHPPVVALLSAFLPTAPSGLHLEAWHVARAFNAVLTLVLLQWVYSKLRQIERGTLQQPESAVVALNIWLLLRGLLTLYIIGCTLYILIAAVTWKNLWPLHIRWFPWK